MASMSRRFVLAIETSTARGSVALGADGKLVEMREIDAARKNAAGLLPAIEATLAGRGVKIGELAALAFSAGPGSFTGVRVAATVARMLNAVARVPIVNVSTLQVIAARAEDDPRRPTHVAAMLDAKRGQIFAAPCQCVPDAAGGHLCEWLWRLAPALHEPVRFLHALTDVAGANPATAARWFANGDGVAAHREMLESAGILICESGLWQPDAAAVLRAAWRRVQRGEFCRPAEVLPIYLRPPECEEVYESRRAAAKAKRGEGAPPLPSGAPSTAKDATRGGGAA